MVHMVIRISITCLCMFRFLVTFRKAIQEGDSEVSVLISASGVGILAHDYCVYHLLQSLVIWDIKTGAKKRSFAAADATDWPIIKYIICILYVRMYIHM